MSKTGDMMRVAFVGSRVRLFGVEDPAHGIAAVAVDDGPEGRADLWGPMTRYNHFVWESEELCPGQHELTIRVTGEKNAESKDHFVSIDRVEVQP